MSVPVFTPHDTEVERMLVLTRKKSEAIRIGDEVRVRILGTGNCVRIGIEAPLHVDIVREELLPVPGWNHDGGPDKRDGAPSDGFFMEGNGRE